MTSNILQESPVNKSKTMKYERVAVTILFALLAAPSCTMSDASYRLWSANTNTLVKDEASRPPPGQYGMIPTIEYDCSRARWPSAMPEVLINAKKQCPETAKVSRYDCVDHSGKIVHPRRCQDSRAPLLVFNVPFPYERYGTSAMDAFDEKIASRYRQPRERQRP